MTTEEETVLMLRGAIASLTKEEQTRVQGALAKIRALSAEFGQAEATIAIALVGAELSASAD